MDSYMRGVNPMRQGRYNPVVSQGEITGKGFPDYDEVAERRANATDSTTLSRSYYGGENDDNLGILPGELVFGLRDRRSVYLSTGEPNEAGLSSLSGFNYGLYGSDEAAMRDYYLLGVSKAAWNPRDPNALDHGIAFLRAGSISVNNTGPQTIYAGDLVCWRNPPTKPSPGRIMYQNTAGTPNTKVLRELVRFDYSDYTSQIAGAFAAMQSSSANDDKKHGVSDLPFDRLFERNGGNDTRALSSLQEEAMALKFALTGIVIRGIRSLVRSGVLVASATDGAGNLDDLRNHNGENSLAQKLGLFSEARNDDQLQLMADLMMGHIDPTDAMATETTNRYQNDPNDDMTRLTQRLMSTLMGGISSAWYSKASRVVGKALNTANSSETLDLMVGHFRPGI